MANRYSSRSAYNSFLINTVTVTADYTVSIMQTGTLFLIDASAAGTDADPTLDISLPSPSHAGMYYKFVWEDTSGRNVNIQLQNTSDAFKGLVIRHRSEATPYLDIAETLLSDRMEFETGTKPGSWVEVHSNGSEWIVYGTHSGSPMSFNNDS